MIYFDTFFAILAVFYQLTVTFEPLNAYFLKTANSLRMKFSGKVELFFHYIHSLFNLKYEFYTVRPKKIRQNSMALKLDLDR